MSCCSRNLWAEALRITIIIIRFTKERSGQFIPTVRSWICLIRDTNGEAVPEIVPVSWVVLASLAWSGRITLSWCIYANLFQGKLLCSQTFRGGITLAIICGSMPCHCCLHLGQIRMRMGFILQPQDLRKHFAVRVKWTCWVGYFLSLSIRSIFSMRDLWLPRILSRGCCNDVESTMYKRTCLASRAWVDQHSCRSLLKVYLSARKVISLGWIPLWSTGNWRRGKRSSVTDCVKMSFDVYINIRFIIKVRVNFVSVCQRTCTTSAPRTTRAFVLSV